MDLFHDADDTLVSSSERFWGREGRGVTVSSVVALAFSVFMQEKYLLLRSDISVELKHSMHTWWAWIHPIGALLIMKIVSTIFKSKR